ncbi:sialin-like isoform X1 [Harmonia axyridis]|uniref:sialin-like isoform X1 n=1 Tax=Harmonia axyridis TaxID=115357 RepID=UPI001E275748|nr:sialin-like isoform X1 [Harmonia axyridis]
MASLCCIPSRALVAMMVFWGTFVNYMFRSHYSISVLAMMQARKVNETLGDFGPRYNWTYEWEQRTISAMFYGLSTLSLPSGMISEMLGPWHVLMWSSIIMAGSSCLIVPVASFGPFCVFALRFVVGMMLALQYPALQCLIGRWAPPNEKGRFSACLMGNAFGSMLTMPVTSMIIEKFGWNWSFYSLSFVVALFCVGLILFVADYPRDYKWIDEEELQYIEKAQGTQVSREKVTPPYLAMFSSVPFIALIIAQFGNLYGLTMSLTATPQFLKRVLNFNLKGSAFIAALPQLSRLICGFFFGYVNDALLRRGVPKKTCRKGFTLLSHIATGMCLCGFLFIGQSSDMAILLLVAMLGFNGAAAQTTLINPQDLSPNFAGTIHGVMNFFGGWGGFIGPMIIEKLTRDNTMDQWAIVFTIGGLIYIISGIVFMFFGSAALQSWNDKSKTSLPPPVAV